MIPVVLAMSLLLAIGAGRHRPVQQPGPPTFSREVVRIFQQHCQSCHHPGGIGPFPLTAYESAKTHAALIRFMTRDRQMPPWKPVEGCGSFEGENRLTDGEIATIGAWVSAGAPEGNRADLPPPLAFPDQWELGPPDIIVQLPVPYRGSTTADTTRLFPLPTVFERDIYVTAMEVRPSARRYVHHAAVYADKSGKADALDAADEEPGYYYGADLGFEPSAFLGTWVPGHAPFRLPEGTAIKVPAGSKIVMDLHLHPRDGQLEPEQTQIGLHLARSTVRKLVNYGSVNNTSFVIPAGNPAYEVGASWTIDRAMTMHGIGAHMHTLATHFLSRAILPGGAEICLLKIDRWKWEWQGLYLYREGVSLPKGTTIEMEGTFDNSESNPNQHFHPPRDIPYGGLFDQEMCFAYFIYTWDDENLAIVP